MLDVIGTDEFSAWYKVLPDGEAEAVTRAVTLLESVGVRPPHARPLELPMRMRHLQALDIPADLQLLDLAVEGSGHHVLFVREGEERVVLLYGYTDQERGSGVAVSLALPPLAHAILAAKVYRFYRAAQGERA